MRWGRGGRGPWKDVWNVITVCVSFVKFQNLDLTKFGDLVLEVRHVFYPSLLLPDGCSHTFLVLIQVLSEGKKKGVDCSGAVTIVGKTSAFLNSME